VKAHFLEIKLKIHLSDKMMDFVWKKTQFFLLGKPELNLTADSFF
jgi:hypothetical protein